MRWQQGVRANTTQRAAAGMRAHNRTRRCPQLLIVLLNTQLAMSNSSCMHAAAHTAHRGLPLVCQTHQQAVSMQRHIAVPALTHIVYRFLLHTNTQPLQDLEQQLIDSISAVQAYQQDHPHVFNLQKLSRRIKSDLQYVRELSAQPAAQLTQTRLQVGATVWNLTGVRWAGTCVLKPHNTVSTCSTLCCETGCVAGCCQQSAWLSGRDAGAAGSTRGHRSVQEVQGATGHARVSRSSSRIIRRPTASSHNTTIVG